MQDAKNNPNKPTWATKLIDVWEEDLDKEAGWLAGIYDGEGTLYLLRDINGAVNFKLSVAQNPGDILNEIQRLLRRKGYPSVDRASSMGFPCRHVTTGVKRTVLRFLGSIRPIRLLKKFSFDELGWITRMEPVRLETKDFLGETDLIGFQTSTGTFVCEGLASHNSLIVSDEMAFQTDSEKAYMGALPSIRGGGKYVGISSANPGFFERMVKDQDRAPWKKHTLVRREIKPETIDAIPD